ncbi:MAG: GatB/YqeY domain-containing protein [Endozoicomonas sp.]
MSECNIRDQLTEAMKESMRNRDKPRLGTIRLALAELKRVEVDEKSLDDNRALAILDKMAKQRRDAIEQFESAGRTDLADQEKLELGILAEFLPEQLSEQAITELVDQAIASSGAKGMGDMGKVMGIVKPQAQGRADMSAISKIVKARLS